MQGGEGRRGGRREEGGGGEREEGERKDEGGWGEEGEPGGKQP